MFKGNEAQLNFLRKKSSEYYKGILLLAERLAEVREIKVVDLYGVKLSYRGIVDDVTVVYDVNRSRVKVYKFTGEKFSLVAENIAVSSKLSVEELAEVLLSFDRTW